MFQQKQLDCERSPEAPVASSNRAAPLSSQLLQSENVTIGPVLPEDTAPIFLWLNDVESTVLDMSYRPVDWMKYNQWLEAFSKGNSQLIFSVRMRSDAKLIGFVVFTNIQAVHRSAEFGIRIGSEADRGKGYGKEATLLALSYAWRHLNLNRIHLSVLEFNERAINAYRATGFQYEGKLRQAAFINGNWANLILMGILRPAQC
jgi:RimJ/RimL family protein N-acetyltransferase